MMIKQSWIHIVIFGAVLFGLMVVSCEKEKKLPSDLPKIEQDTVLVPEDTSVVQDITEIEKKWKELQVMERMDSLFAELQNRQRNLKEAETRLKAKSDSLRLWEVDLEVREKELTRKQILAWIIFGVGLVALIVAAFIVKKKRLEKDIE